MRPFTLLSLLASGATLCSAAIGTKPCALAAAATGGGFTFNLTLCPSTLVGGSESWGNQILLDVPPNTDPGIDLALISDNPAATVAPVVNVPGGSTTQIFHILTTPVAVETQVRITVIYAGASTYAILTLMPAPGACATNAGASFRVQLGGYLYSRVTKRFVQSVTLTNTSGSPIAGPVSVVLTGLSPHASLYAPSGVTTCLAPAGSPYREVLPPGTPLAPGASKKVSLEFVNPSMQLFTYSVLVAAGATR